MSDDLYFRVPKGRTPVSRQDFLGYFQSRPLYQVSEQQAWYGNEMTGVYFNFDHLAYEEESGAGREPEGTEFAQISFNINYYRPRIFGLEAEPEVAAFVRHLQLLTDDPQTDGMGRSPYSAEGFLRGWNSGNRAAYGSLQKGADTARPPSLPTPEIERLWKWNAPGRPRVKRNSSRRRCSCPTKVGYGAFQYGPMLSPSPFRTPITSS